VKKVECIIRQEKLKEVSHALRLTGVAGVTVTEVKGFGKESIRPDNYLFIPKTKIELYVTDDQVEDIIRAITQCCKEETIGCGKIAVFPLKECIRIRTQERGEKAIL
jgi:nitrogen regulatory protein PII